MDRVSDSELLERARQGRADAFSTLVRRHDRYLYRMARSILRDDQEAEDVVQETYLKAFMKIVDFRGEANLRTWLTRIALNEALQRKRRQRLHVELGEVDMARERVRSQMHLSPLTQATPEREVARKQIRQILEGAIDDLPPAFRTVLVMRDVEGASVEETANVLGVKAETVRTRLHRARNMLRERLGEQFAAVLKGRVPVRAPALRRPRQQASGRSRVAARVVRSSQGLISSSIEAARLLRCCDFVLRPQGLAASAGAA
jgi:RNA polymerase sigma-70 factor, ECF subfamily